MKIAIIGYSGSGKSTLAKYLSNHYDIPALFLDKVKFLPNWCERDTEEGRLIVSEFMKNDSWVIDGNYSNFFQRERLEQADKIIFMNLPRITCMKRAYKRYHKYKNTTREDMAEGCIEKMDLEFAWWILYEGRTKERVNRFTEIEREFKDKTIVLKSQKDIDLYLKNMKLNR